jgi:flagella basal body P-ring formation protein FlgA
MGSCGDRIWDAGSPGVSTTRNNAWVRCSSFAVRSVLVLCLLPSFAFAAPSTIEISDLQLSAAQPQRPPSAIVVERTPPGRSVFRFEFSGGKSLIATALVRGYDHVVMTRSGFRKGYVLKQGDIYSTLMETYRIPKGALREEARVIGKTVLRSVAANMPVTEVLVSDSPIVKRGRKVVLAVESTDFSIRTMGEIRSDAVVGEYVKVLNVLSKRMVSGFLVDENTVRVEF